MAVLRLGLQLVITVTAPSLVLIGEVTLHRGSLSRVQNKPNRKHKYTNTWKNSIPWVIKEIQIKIRYHALSMNLQNNFLAVNIVLVEHMETISHMPTGKYELESAFQKYDDDVYYKYILLIS